MEHATSPADLELKMNGFGSGDAAVSASSGKSVPIQEKAGDFFDLK
jgi:hypothetical protein